jgi:two-component system, LytTR family, sensor kinase
MILLLYLLAQVRDQNFNFESQIYSRSVAGVPPVTAICRPPACAVKAGGLGITVTGDCRTKFIDLYVILPKRLLWIGTNLYVYPVNNHTSFWRKKIIWNISVQELCIFLFFHVVVAFSYWTALVITMDMHLRTVERAKISTICTAVNFTVKFMLTIPVYWLIFWKYRHWHLQNRLALHLLAWPLYIYVWIEGYYFILDQIPGGERFHLKWPGSFWDYFIGSLMYIVQFAAFHIYENHILLKKQQAKEKELLRLTYQSEMNALKAQIQPHFLFNTLNSISATVPSELERTRELIARLADTFRFALNASANEMIPLQQELDFTKAYLELENERFKDRLSVHYDVDPAILEMQVPPMLLQPLVENSLKHGIAKSLKGGRVEIKIHRRQHLVRFEIADTGTGLGETSKEIAVQKGMGLKNTGQRLQKLYNTSIVIQDNKPSGVRVIFDIPYL